MNETNKFSLIMKTGLSSVMVGLGIYFIVTAICILIFWFSPVPESWMTYAGGVCLSIGCLTAGIKMGSGIAQKGILVGLLAALILSLILWGTANIITGGSIFDNSSSIKFLSGAVAGIIGGMIGVNMGR